MKKKVLITLSVCAMLFSACKENNESNIKKDLESIDSKIASGFDNLKDTLKIKDNSNINSDEFKTVTLDKNFTSLEGTEITFKNILKANEGKTIVIDIWASWCPDCIKGIPSIEKMQEQFPDVAYVFLSLDKTPEAWKEAIEKYKLKGSHYYLNEKMSGEFGKSIDLDWIPRYIIVNKEGKIVDYKSIAADDKTFLFILKNSEKKDQ
ncbi:TlpA family protein disulfide reductase [Flavobacterium sp. I3-2]|uniref:TlpA family protein disulfide reductase n=1 Tax=Flavobacterium sp. I3-2 TaxID=2748319 RepID=UPI0015AD17FC|nr:TlpA disulfide reductase family protein [Flavobacterium sp. I3-2]